MANVNVPGAGVNLKADGLRESLEQKIASLVGDVSKVFHDSEKGRKLEGVLLIGEKYLERIYNVLLDEGFTAVFIDGKDEPRLPNSRLYEIRLEEYFKGY